MIVGVPYDAEVEYLMLNGEQVTIPSGSIPVRVGSVGYIYTFASRALSDGNNDYVLGPDAATPTLGIYRYPNSSSNMTFGKIDAKNMLYKNCLKQTI